MSSPTTQGGWSSGWFANLWRRKAPNQVVQHHLIELDQCVESPNERGRGAYGAVFKVKYNGANCVAKRILDILVGFGDHQYVDEDQYRRLLERFRAECDLLSKFRHPNVVQFLGICQPTADPRTLTLVMEEMHMNLKEFIETSKPIETKIKLGIIRDISAGLLHIHSHGVIHRDLNAGNVLLTQDLRAKIADFGMSRVTEEKATRRGDMTVMPGAPDCMPPEAGEGSYDKKLDTFSFGHMVLYLTLEEYPTPKYYTTLAIRRMSADVNIEILKRKEWLDRMGKDHMLYDLTVQCLMDDPEKRPTMSDINKQITELCTSQLEKSVDYMILKNQLAQYKTAIMEIVGKLPDFTIVSESRAQTKEVDDLKQQLRESNEEKERITNQHSLEKNTVVQEKETLIQEKEALMQEKEALMQEKEALIQEKEALMQEKEALMQEKEALTQEKDEEIHQKEESINQVQAQLSREKASFLLELQEKDERINQKESMIQLKDNVIAEQYQTIEQLQSQTMTETNEESDRKDELIAKQADELKKLREELHEKEKMMQTANKQMHLDKAQLEEEKRELEHICRQHEGNHYLLVEQKSQLTETIHTVQRNYELAMEDKRKLEDELFEVKMQLKGMKEMTHKEEQREVSAESNDPETQTRTRPRLKSTHVPVFPPGDDGPMRAKVLQRPQMITTGKPYEEHEVSASSCAQPMMTGFTYTSRTDDDDAPLTSLQAKLVRRQQIIKALESELEGSQESKRHAIQENSPGTKRRSMYFELESSQDMKHSGPPPPIPRKPRNVKPRQYEKQNTSEQQ